jgi:hypothetical protein
MASKTLIGEERTDATLEKLVAIAPGPRVTCGYNRRDRNGDTQNARAHRTVYVIIGGRPCLVNEG